jgi:hypothetical protein
MTREILQQKLRESRELREQFDFEVKEREAIICEKEEVENAKSLALESQIQAWLLK